MRGAGACHQQETHWRTPGPETAGGPGEGAQRSRHRRTEGGPGQQEQDRFGCHLQRFAGSGEQRCQDVLHVDSCSFPAQTRAQL